MRRRVLLLASFLAALTAVVVPHRSARGAAVDEAPEPRPKNAPSPTVLATLREAAQSGDRQAQYDLAVVLDCGLGARRDPAAAFLWLEKAAMQGHIGAQSALGWKYMVGDGVPPDDSAAFQWLRRAAERGNTSAQNNVGILYAQGRGVAVDLIEAAKWFRKAADKGAVDAQRNLQALQAGRSRDVRPSAQPLRPRV